MAVVKELLRTEADKTLSFGDYKLPKNLKHLISHIREMFIK